MNLQTALNTYLPLVLDSAELATWRDLEQNPPSIATTTSPSSTLLHECTLVTDSRQLPPPSHSPHCIFIPLLGPNFNGHSFINDALDKGATGYLYDPRYHQPVPATKVPVLGVPVINTRKAYMALAAAHRRHTLSHSRLIAISGSCGKTTLRSYLHQILAQYGTVISTLDNHNNELGVSETLLRAQASTQFVVCEMGMRHRTDLAQLVKIARPDVCVLTGVEPSHLSCVGDSLDEVYAGKLELFHGAPKAVWIAPSSNPRLMAELSAGHSHAGCFSEGHDPAIITQLAMDEVRAVATRPNYASLTTTIELIRTRAASPPEAPITLTVDTIHSAAPRLVAAAICAASQVLPAKPLLALNHLTVQTQTRGRFAVIHHSPRGLIIDDTYNASPASMQAGLMSVLQWLDHQPQPFSGTCTLILGDMLELGQAAAKFHHDLGQWLHGRHHERHSATCPLRLHLLLCGPLSQQIAAGWHSAAGALASATAMATTINQYTTVAELLAGAPLQSLLQLWSSAPPPEADPPSLIYLKASHGMEFVKLVAQLKSVIPADSTGQLYSSPHSPSPSPQELAP